MAVTYPGATTFPGATLTPGTYTTGTVPAGTELVTLVEAKRVAPQAPNQSSSDYDADLTAMIAAVSRHLALTYDAPLPGTRTKRVRQWQRTTVLPLGCTVTAVAAGAVALTGWDFDADSGLLYDAPLRGYVYGPVDITYTVPVLPDVREAALLVIRHAWNTRYGALIGTYATTTDEPYAASPSGFYVPNRAKELLAPYGTKVA